MNYEIIDFHTHPFLDEDSNICVHKEYIRNTPENTPEYLKSMGISRICGSVICKSSEAGSSQEAPWAAIVKSNAYALELQRRYGDFYIPGFHVHPDYVKESCEEIEKMHGLGLRLIGELVPYHHGWEDYSCQGFDEILDVAAQYHMVVSLHTMYPEKMAEMLKKHPDTVIVGAHPGEAGVFAQHLELMKLSHNYYLDLSGTGLFRHGLLRHGIDEFGPERFLLGSDYPICNPAMFVGGVLLDGMITEEEKKLVLAGNAKRLLGL